MRLNELFDRARLLTQPEGTYDRFRETLETIHDLMKPYLDNTGTPEEQKNLLIGHFGIKGETNNTLSQLLLSITDDLKANPESEKALMRIALLSMLDTHPSQYSHTTHSGENVIAALNRIIDGIGQWVDEHGNDIPSIDRLRIINCKREFASALDEIYDFMEFAKPYFKEAAPTASAPTQKPL